MKGADAIDLRQPPRTGLRHPSLFLKPFFFSLIALIAQICDWGVCVCVCVCVCARARACANLCVCVCAFMLYALIFDKYVFVEIV